MRARFAFFLTLLTFAPPSRAALSSGESEAQAFHEAAKLYRQSTGDRSGAAEAFRRFTADYPRSARAADAYFALGEIAFDRGLARAGSGAGSSFAQAGSDAPLSDEALRRFQEAGRDYEAAAKKAGDDGLRATARYRLGELAYDSRDWASAQKQFQAVLDGWPKSYVAPASLLGLVYAALAQEDFKAARARLKQLAADYPRQAEGPEASLVRGVLAFHDGDYAEAEKRLSGLDAPQARYFLGRAYLAWQKPLLAATVFNKLLGDAGAPDLREAASFYLGDAFFLSKDYDGAIDRYTSFVRTYPFSRYKVAALYRIGSASFEKGDYGQARLSFGSLLSQFPNDYYASLARYFIGESYLLTDQTREALFAYSEVAAGGRPELKARALYRLAWTQQSLGDFGRASQTCRLFLDSFPSDALAKDVYLILANSQARLGKPDAALAAYQRVLDVAPGSEVAEEALFLMLKLQYDRKSYGSILTSYQYILSQLPQSLSKWRGLSYVTAAETYLRLNRTDEARAIYEMVLKVYPNDLAAVYAQDGLAWCYQLSGKPEEALAARKKLAERLKVESSTGSVDAVNDLGIADSFFAQKDYQDAYSFYGKFADGNPQSPSAAAALYRAGLSLYRMKYYGQAVDTWKKLVAQAPASPEAAKASYQIADTLFRGGKPAEAEAAYKALLARSPKGPQAGLAALRLAQLSFQAGRDDEALERAKRVVLDYADAGSAGEALDLAEAVFDRAPQRDFRSYLSGIVAAAPQGAAAGEAQFRLGRRLYEQKDYADAAKALERFSIDYTGHPQLAKAQLLLGQCDEQLQKLPEAAAAYERYAVNYPSDADVPLALFKLGGVQYQLKDYAGAAASWSRLLTQAPQSPYAKPARFNLALAYRDAGQDDAAAAEYSAYIGAGATDQEAQAARWELYQLAKKRKDYKGALAALEQIRAKAAPGSPDEVAAAYEAGELAASMGEQADALKAWQEAASMKPVDEPHRLQSLVRLAQAYEKNSDWSKAEAAYEDLARHAKPDVAAAARERIAQLRSK